MAEKPQGKITPKHIDSMRPATLGGEVMCNSCRAVNGEDDEKCKKCGAKL